MSECTIGLSEQEIKLHRQYGLTHIKAKNKQVNKHWEDSEESFYHDIKDVSVWEMEIFLFNLSMKLMLLNNDLEVKIELYSTFKIT